MRSLVRPLLVGALGLGTVLLGVGPALAAAPFAPTEQLTDSADVLSAGEESDVADALSQLQSDSGTQLYVVYVDSFDGMDGDAWAAQAFELAGLGDNDVLFAATTDTQPGHDGYFVGDNTDLDEADFSQLITSEVEPQLGQGDWSAAAVTLADELHGGGGNSGGAALGVLAGIAVVGGGGYALLRSRRRRKQAAAQQRAAEERAAAEAAARDPHHGTPTEQLLFRASSELLALDEAVKTSELDLAYARSQYGEEPVAGFQQALDQSKAELSRAFTIRQELDDDVPEDEPTQRRMLTELLQLTGSADARLDSQAEAYGRLRQLQDSAPEALAALTPAIATARAQLPVAERALADLQQRYAPSAWSVVAANATEAGARIDLAEQAVAHGRAELDAGLPAGAVPAIRAAEDALAQSRTLLEAVSRLAAELGSVGTRFDEVRTETEKDIAEARSLLSRNVDTPGLRQELARAEAALSSADAQLRPRDGALPDPLAVVRRLDEADLALEAALEPARDARQQQERAAAHLQQAFRAADASVSVAGDFIATRRGAVGSSARTRLAEAERYLDEASRLGATDPLGALRAAQRADGLAQQALAAAQQDVEDYYSRGPGGYGGGYGGRGYGGGGYGGGGFAGGVAGGVLGSILLGGLGGGFGGGYGGGGGFGGGDGGGDGGGGGGDFGGGGSF
jgi:flagellin-like hook-associated protein FlgL